MLPFGVASVLLARRHLVVLRGWGKMCPMNEPDPYVKTGEDVSLPAVPVRNAGQSLVAKFRAARLQQRSSVHSELRADREALRQERLTRLGKAPAPESALATVEVAPAASGSVGQKVEQAEAPVTGSSMFAQFIGGVQAEVAAVAPAPAHAAGEASTPSVSVSSAAAPPLSSIGFGPGMVIRFRQLGIETAADLATADAAGLRTALGDITRLINVDIWIASAQKACAEAA